jgi:gliding motility-associated protein GldM
MAAGKLTPRQKMINMMYLVLTALLALNVSKEVLNSFFEVNTGIVRSTNNFIDKNLESYSEFDNAVNNNPEKFQDVRDRAYSVKKQADNIAEHIQEMKYDLVYYADKKQVSLGAASEVLDEDGKQIKDKTIKDTKWKDLTDEQKLLPISYLSNKKDRDKAGDLFFPKSPVKEKRATVLKNKIILYRDSLIDLVPGNDFLISKINEVCDVSNKGSGKKLQTWEHYNFVDMPSVAALTILSKIQSDMRNIEADVINYLKKNIDAKSLKFTSAEGIQIPKTNFVLRGDSFRAEIFITAKNENQNPDIYVGEYDSLGGGRYEMVGDYETIKVVNGKGMFATRTTSEGSKKWGGLIAMKTETGTKMYPFNGEYLVAAKTAVVSPTNMNILYLEVDNPLKISVPGYTAGEISAVINNGKVSATKKSLGEYSARPSKKGKATVSLYASVDGKRSKMGGMEFRVKEVPPPKAKVQFAINTNGTLVIDKMKMVNAGGLMAKLEDFDFKGVRYMVTGFRLSGVYKGEQMKEDTKGPQFSSKMLNIIKNTKAGNAITISNIKARRVDAKNTAERALDPLVIEIK